MRIDDLVKIKVTGSWNGGVCLVSSPKVGSREVPAGSLLLTTCAVPLLQGVSECLGKGVSGTVWKVVDKSVNEVLALKVSRASGEGFGLDCRFEVSRPIAGPPTACPIPCCWCGCLASLQNDLAAPPPHTLRKWSLSRTRVRAPLLAQAAARAPAPDFPCRAPWQTSAV